MSLKTDRESGTTAPLNRVASSVGSAASEFMARLHAGATVLWTWAGRSAPARYVSGTLLRRILVSNLLGLIVLVVGVLYLSMTQDRKSVV